MEDEEYVPSDEEFNENDVLYSEELAGQEGHVSEDEMDLDAADADNVEDDAILKLVGHAADKDVFAIAVAKSAKWFASGAEDDSAAVWNIQSDSQDPAFRVSGHSDSVHCVDFNSSGSLLASGDMSGRIIVTDVESNVTRCEIDQCDDLEWLLWHSQADILFAGAKDGLVWMWLIGKAGVVQSKNFISSSAAACVAGRLLPDAKRLIAVYADGQVCIWNVKDGTAQSLQVPDQCTALDVHPDPNTHLAAIGLESGRMVLVNTETAKEVAMLGSSLPSDRREEEEEVQEEKTSVEVVSFCKEFPWVAAGTSSGVVHIYDYEKSALRHALDHGGNAVVRCFWKAQNNELYLFVACFDGAIRIWDAKSGTPHKVIEGAGVGIYDLCLVSKDDQEYISTACGQGTIRFFNYSL